MQRTFNEVTRQIVSNLQKCMTGIPSLRIFPKPPPVVTPTLYHLAVAVHSGCWFTPHCVISVDCHNSCDNGKKSVGALTPFLPLPSDSWAGPASSWICDLCHCTGCPALRQAACWLFFFFWFFHLESLNHFWTRDPVFSLQIMYLVLELMFLRIAFYYFQRPPSSVLENQKTLRAMVSKEESIRSGVWTRPSTEVQKRNI